MISKDKILSRYFLLFFYSFLFAAGILSEGWLQPDEHARVLEPAHKIVYGYATLPWEFNQDNPIVSFLLGAIHAPILMVTKYFELSGMTEAVVLRIFSGLLNSSRIYALLGILLWLGFSARVSKFYTAAYAIGIYGILLFVRTSQENYATTAFLWSFWCLTKIFDCDRATYSFTLRSPNDFKLSKFVFWSGFLVSFATSLRLQVGVSALFFVIFFFLRFPTRQKILFVNGLLLGVIPLALVDIYFNGVPFKPALNYLKYALSDEDGGTLWGVDPWFWYIKEYFTSWYPPASLLLLPLLLLGLYRFRFATLIFVPFFVVHSALGHKEMRYMGPMVPWLFLATIIGFEEFKSKSLWYQKISEYRPFVGLRHISWGLYYTVGLLGCLITLNNAPRLYNKMGKLYRNKELPYGIVYAGNTASGPSLFYTKAPGLKYYGMSADELLERTRTDQWLKGVSFYAHYALRFDEIQELTMKCPQVYPKLKFLFDDLYLLIPKEYRRLRYSGIVSCPTFHIQQSHSTGLIAP